jgi:hypothetical protein
MGNKLNIRDMKAKWTYLFFLFFLKLNAQQSDSVLPKLFFDCKADFCDNDYFRQQLPYLNFVFDRRLSDIYVLMTSQENGSGGNSFAMYFFDKGNFEKCIDTIFTNIPDNTSDGDSRTALLTSLNRGLLPFLMKTKLKDQITYKVDFNSNSVKEQTKNDKWNFWSFSVNADGNGSVDANYKNLNSNFSFGANRVTDKLKVNMGHYSGLNYTENKIDDTTTAINRQYYGGFYNNLAISINDRWAYGYFMNVFRGTFDNFKLFTNIGPAVEYNIFSVKEATRRQLRIIDRLTLRRNEYYRTTIFDRNQETRFVNSIIVMYSQVENWGSLNARFGYFQHLHDIRVFRISILPEVQINLLKGLSINIGGIASLQRDQINLPKAEASADDINLRRFALPSNYRFDGFIGFSYRFGSIYNNVINPRFDLADDFY